MATPSDPVERYSSRLSAKADRFISELFANTIENGWRRAEDFLDHFSVEALLAALADEEELRVKLLVETTGTHEKIAAKKSPSSAAEDLRLALDEGTTTPDAVLALFDADDWVRLLGARPLWAFLTEDRFWHADPEDPSAFAEALERVSDTIHGAIRHKLLTEADVVEAVGFERFAQQLEESQLREIVVSALECGKRKEAFTVESLLDVIPLESIFEKVSLGRTWSEVVVLRVEQPLELGHAGPPRRSSSPPEALAEAKPKAKPARSQSRDTAKSPRDRKPAPRGTERQPAEPERAAKPEPAPPPPAPDEPEERGSRAESRQLTPPTSARRRSVPPPRAPSSAPPPPPPPPPAAPPPVQAVNSSRPAPPPARPQSIPPPPPSARAGAARPAPPTNSAPPPPPNDPVGAQAVARLSRIDRLPSRHSEFPAAVLHAIESMYGELATVSDAQEQLNVIKDAFPNDLWRSRAMLALLELLNPTALSSSPEIFNESADALSIRLLTEERQLSRNAAQGKHGRPGAR